MFYINMYKHKNFKQSLYLIQIQKIIKKFIFSWVAKSIKYCVLKNL